MIILGIDPGTATTGYGVISISKKRKILKSSSLESKAKKINLKMIHYGCIRTSPKTKDAERLKKINNNLSRIVKKHKPNILAIENIFFFRNMKSALPVSQAKGVIMLTAAKKNLPIFEFSPLEVKMTIDGYGWAKKKEVQQRIKSLFNLKEVPKPDDAADALGIAICGAFQQCYYKKDLEREELKKKNRKKKKKKKKM